MEWLRTELVARSPLLLCFLAAQGAFAQTPAAAAPPMGAAWDDVIATAIPAAPADPALTQPQPAAKTGAGSEFLNHFYFESRTNFEHYGTTFTGNRELNGVINTPFTGVFNPNGIPYPPAFQPTANRIYSFIDFGTRGYGSERVKTHFALRQRQDLNAVQPGAPGENIVETFRGRRVYEWLDASVEIDSKPEDGKLAGTSLELGRLNVYGAEIASLDGASFTITRPRFTATLFGGRRFSYYSEPQQRAIGGGNLLWKIDPKTSVELESLWYIKGLNRLTLRRRINERLLVTSYVRSWGGSLVDFDFRAFYSALNGKTTVHGGFFQKLTDNDFTYDYTVDARDNDPRNRLLRLYLGPITQYSQFNLDAHRQVTSRFRAGGAVAVRRLNDANSQGAFDTSFEDYRLNAQVFPWRRIETFLEYHQRNTDRLSPATTVLLDDIRFSGETSVKDMTAEVRRAFGEGRVTLSAGMYYRRVSMQDAFYYVNNLHQTGVLGSAWVRLDRRTRLYFDYSLDNDFYLFQPDLKNSQEMRMGVAWKY